jgi:hypothetical protein
VIIEQARIDDLPVILAMRKEASDWLAKQGIDQWAAAWPTPEAQSERILSSIRAGETWMVRDDEVATAATAALDTFSDPKLWTPEEQQQPSLLPAPAYRSTQVRRTGHRRDPVGLQASRGTRQRLGPDRRLERQCRPSPVLRATRVHHVRTLDLIDYPSGALFQRKATDRREARTDAVITELTHDLPISRQQPGTSARLIRPALLPSIA